jgi:hypothetical protein
MNIEHFGRLETSLILSGMDTIDRTDIDAGRVLGTNAWLADDVGHVTLSSYETVGFQDQTVLGGQAGVNAATPVFGPIIRFW